jgi:hypothetical protein
MSRPATLFSFDQTLALSTGIAASFIGLVAIDDSVSNPPAIAAAIGLIAFLSIAILSLSRFKVTQDAIECRYAFRTQLIPLAMIERVGGRRRWTLLAHQSVVFVLDGTSGVNGKIYRIGLFSSPSAATWCDAVNQAVSLSKSVAVRRR